MQKYGVAVILMKKNSENISLIRDPGVSFEEMAGLNPLEPFSDEVCGFLDRLSRIILASPECKPYPDGFKFGFFCSSSSISAFKQRYADSINYRLGRGLTFHIAPSNVPVNFAYSLVAGLLAGNPCVVRASSRDFVQTRLICSAIDSALNGAEGEFLNGFAAVITYPREKAINDYLSSLCAVRVIWGGDETIADIRRSPLPPSSFDVLFADRYSFSLVHAQRYLQECDAEKTAVGFYKYTFLFVKNACTAPHLIYWVGDEKTVSDAKDRFWSVLGRIVREKYSLPAILSMDKLVAVCSAAIGLDGVHLVDSDDGMIKRLCLDHLNDRLPEHRCGGGLFYEYRDTSLEAIYPFINTSFQTLSVIGYEPGEIISKMVSKRVRGIDRVVPVGRTLDFDLVWDGYDLIQTMSRVIFPK